MISELQKNEQWNSVSLGIPGIHNAENALACVAVARELGIDESTIRTALDTFKGVKRRFDVHVVSDDVVYIDDYAHHPTEIKSLIDSIRLLYPSKQILGVFQPHLFTRTRDFFEGFAEELSRLDELMLLPIYPARELPIPGVTSDALLDKIALDKKRVIPRDEVPASLNDLSNTVLLTIGAGDIDRIVPTLIEQFAEKA